jgi:hypothetical protein
MWPAMHELASAERNVTITENTGVVLAGVVLRSGTDSAKWIYFLHGNQGNLSTCQAWLEAFHALGVNVFAVDYRGFGESTGIPSEQGLYSDAKAGYDFVVDSLHVKPRDIVLYGYSLGSAVAIELATHTHPAGLIIEGGMISIPARGQEIFPFLPVAMIAHDRFDGASQIGALSCPKLIFHARDDEVIPFHHGQTLFRLAKSPKAFVETHGGHVRAITNDQATMTNAIAAFLRRATPVSGR